MHLNLLGFVFGGNLHTICLMMAWTLCYLWLIKRVSWYFFLLCLLGCRHQCHIRHSDLWIHLLLVRVLFGAFVILVVPGCVNFTIYELATICLSIPWLSIGGLLAVALTSIAMSPLRLSWWVLNVIVAWRPHLALLKVWAQGMRAHLQMLLIYAPNSRPRTPLFRL